MGPNFATATRASPAVAAVARSEGHVPGHGPRSRHAKAARNTPPQRDDGSGHAPPRVARRLTPRPHQAPDPEGGWSHPVT